MLDLQSLDYRLLSGFFIMDDDGFVVDVNDIFFKSEFIVVYGVEWFSKLFYCGDYLCFKFGNIVKEFVFGFWWICMVNVIYIVCRR